MDDIEVKFNAAHEVLVISDDTETLRLTREEAIALAAKLLAVAVLIGGGK